MNTTPPATQFQFRGSKTQFHISVIATIVLLCIDAQLAYQSLLGKGIDFIIGLVLCLTMTALAGTYALVYATIRLTFDGDILHAKSLFTDQSVSLKNLSRATRATSGGGKWPSLILRLQDSHGLVLNLRPGDYASSDLNTILAVLYPYIFITRVDKNFSTQFFDEMASNG